MENWEYVLRICVEALVVMKDRNSRKSAGEFLATMGSPCGVGLFISRAYFLLLTRPFSLSAKNTQHIDLWAPEGLNPNPRIEMYQTRGKTGILAGKA